MKALFKMCLGVVLASVAFVGFAAATVTPAEQLLVQSNNPNTDMICNLNGGSQPVGTSFCGKKPSSMIEDPNSCFEHVAVNGCKVINKGTGVNCSWPALYAELHSKPSLDFICHSVEWAWCVNPSKGHGTAAECAKIEASCRSYDSQFYNTCLVSSK